MSTHMSIKDAAKLLSMSEQRVRELCRSNALPAKRISRSWIIEKNDVEHYGLLNVNMIAEDHATYKVRSKRDNKPIALSFFSGAMGLDIGLERSGFEVLLACEIDKYCRGS